MEFGEEKLVKEIEPVIRHVVHPGKFYFYIRPDGSTFYCDGKQARHEHKRNKQFGVSDGSTYFKLMEAAKKYQDQQVKLINNKKISKAKKESLLEKLYSEIKTKTGQAFEAEKKKAKGHFEYPGDLEDLSTVPLNHISPLVKKAVDGMIQ